MEEINKTWGYFPPQKQLSQVIGWPSIEELNRDEHKEEKKQVLIGILDNLIKEYDDQ